MNSRIFQSLEKQFTQHRVIFWDDDQNNLHDDFEAFKSAHPDIQCVEVDNNEFSLGYRILRQEPEQPFLIYRRSIPEQKEDWLLYLSLASYVFHADKIDVWRTELGLDVPYRHLIQSHQAFFGSQKRIDKLKHQIDPLFGYTEDSLRIQMLGICANTVSELNQIILELLKEYADDKQTKMTLIEQCGLADFLWDQIKQQFHYTADVPNWDDFVLQLFKTCCEGIGFSGPLNTTARALMTYWMDSNTYLASFKHYSNDLNKMLNVQLALSEVPLEDLLDINCFIDIDFSIIVKLIEAVENRTMTRAAIEAIVRKRQDNIWCRDEQLPANNLYQTVLLGADFLDTLSVAQLSISDLTDGIQKYAKTWYRIDQLYRQFNYHAKLAGSKNVTASLVNTVENHYCNSYLSELGLRFQQQIDKDSLWRAQGITSQADFFEHYVTPYLAKNGKVCVIISDAMRYEIGEELSRQIARLDRYETKVEPMLSMLPSYTQLGMAALLPNKTLEIVGKDINVLVDGQPSAGLENRKKILADIIPKSDGYRAEDFMALSRDEGREIFRSNDVLYFYHDVIDKTGENTPSNLPDAASVAIEELCTLIRRLVSCNASNFLITADHGFLFRQGALEDVEFTEDKPDGGVVYKVDRQFIIGEQLQDKPTLYKFMPDQLKLSGTLEIQIPKSIQRIRKQGSDGRYVHGGASLQESIVPVVIVRKARTADVSQVNVSVISSNRDITTSQLIVKFYQEAAVSDKVQPRELRIGLYTEDGKIVAPAVTKTFNSESEHVPEREQTVIFKLSSGTKLTNNQVVLLKMEEQYKNTQHFNLYKEEKFKYHVMIQNDGWAF